MENLFQLVCTETKFHFLSSRIFMQLHFIIRYITRYWNCYKCIFMKFDFFKINCNVVDTISLYIVHCFIFHLSGCILFNMSVTSLKLNLLHSLYQNLQSSDSCVFNLVMFHTKVLSKIITFCYFSFST